MKPFRNKAFPYYDKIGLILGDHAARGGGAHYPSEVVPLTINDGNDAIDAVEAGPAGPSTSAIEASLASTEASLASAIAVASVAVVSSHLPSPSLSALPALSAPIIDLYSTDAMDVDPGSSMPPATSNTSGNK